MKSRDEILRLLDSKLKGFVPASEMREMVETVLQIDRLKEERNAVILGHNYINPVLLFSLADFTGDSLELCRKAAGLDKETILFCGVRFMAETAKILNPEKEVLIPSPKAGCSLAESITASEVRELKEMYPGVPVVTYINTYAEVKAESDICCTSGNAARVIESLGGDTVIFIPDEYLAKNVARESGKEIIVPSKTSRKAHRGGVGGGVIRWHGRCEVHERFSLKHVEEARKRDPGVIILAHPECSPEVASASDMVGSTAAMIKYIEQNKKEDIHRSYLILTECCMTDYLSVAHPEADFACPHRFRCPHMEEITMEETLRSLQEKRYRIEVPEEIRIRALRSVERMLELH